MFFYSIIRSTIFTQKLLIVMENTKLITRNAAFILAKLFQSYLMLYSWSLTRGTGIVGIVRGDGIGCGDTNLVVTHPCTLEAADLLYHHQIALCDQLILDLS